MGYRIACAECGEDIPPDAPGHAVSQRVSYYRVYGWLCAKCCPRFDAGWSSKWNLQGYGTVIGPLPCEWCGRLVVVRWHHARRYTSCSNRCSVYIGRERRRQDRRDHPPACATCGAPVAAIRSDSRYCSSACRQKAYRRRKADAHAEREEFRRISAEYEATLHRGAT